MGGISVNATEFVRNFRKFLDSLELTGEEIVIVRNHQEVARLIPGPAHQTALEAMADLYRTLSKEAAADWITDSRRSGEATLDEEIQNPWAT
ncbi:prevent-host-death family protein [Nitrosococcus halophilus Nc 4]|uniref:Prevent-host-death family protein n=1 Tax=Nitrosococcus halophilus (strain Nc4) TaxID=472759 RepID=D5C175_NITHN|nr:type II toxin-antitoxin system Phd/YefM family antitoxin [Nitrosococcus halophilus]ADE14632.1 prevent-host-death family protein [Nitrosococcus halophilus Nc 4]